MEQSPQHSQFRESYKENRRKGDIKALLALLAFAGITTAIGIGKIDSRKIERLIATEIAPRASQTSSNESLYVTQAREIARSRDMMLLVDPERFEVNRGQLGVEGYPNAIQQGATIMEKGVRELVLDYNNNPFQDRVVTFIHQADPGDEKYLTGQHLNSIYFVTPEEDTQVELRQYVIAFGGNNQERFNYTMQAGYNYAFIPVNTPNAGENSISNDIQYDPATGGAIVYPGGQTIYDTHRHDYTQSERGGRALVLLALSPFDPSTGEQSLSVLGVVNDNSVQELRNNTGTDLEVIEYARQNSEE